MYFSPKIQCENKQTNGNNSKLRFHIITGRNEVLAKVIFSQASVCPQGGGGLGIPACLAGQSQGGLQFFGGVSNFPGGGGRGVSNFSEYGQRSAGTHPTGMHSC